MAASSSGAGSSAVGGGMGAEAAAARPLRDPQHAQQQASAAAATVRAAHDLLAGAASALAGEAAGGNGGGGDGGGAFVHLVAEYRAAIRAVSAELAARGLSADDSGLGDDSGGCCGQAPPPDRAAGCEGGGRGGGEGSHHQAAGAAAATGAERLASAAAGPALQRPAATATATDAGARAAASAAAAAWRAPPHCVPIHANVCTFDWAALAAAARFDAIMMDPPWQLATANPTRGVALGYSQLSDASIAALPVPCLQPEGGLLFVWVINAKYKFVLDLFDAWGYEMVDEIVWVKTTINQRLFKSHGYYLQHAKEVCLVGRKGGPGPSPAGGSAEAARVADCCDVIISERRGQSQKPEEIYDIIEALVPGGRYLEIFARRNNLRNFWVSIGNEVGVGLPDSDLVALREGGAVPGARFGRGAG